MQPGEALSARTWLVVALCALVLASGQTVSLAHTQWPAERRMSQFIRRARVARDLPDPTHGTRLHRFARAEVKRMMACRCVKHAQPPLWCRQWGQVIGIGSDARTIFRAFMDSSVHRRALLDPSFRRLGVGARRFEGNLYVAVELCR